MGNAELGIEVPSWSGQEVVEGDRMLVAIHVADERSFHFDGWEHENFYESEDGEIEYHIYKRRR